MTGLDGVRGLAALTVIIAHSANTGFFPSILSYGTGQFGVMLFFTLSDFLMTTLYSKEAFTHTEAARYLIARFARIYPLYITVVIISFLIYSFVDSTFFFPRHIDSTRLRGSRGTESPTKRGTPTRILQYLITLRNDTMEIPQQGHQRGLQAKEGLWAEASAQPCPKNT